MNRKGEYWVVEYQNRGSWHTDDTGPHILYYEHDQATAWAIKLAQVHPVRLRHTIDEYEEVPPA